MLEKLKRIDWAIVIILFLFMAISTLLVYSASVDDPLIHLGIEKIVLVYAVCFIGFFGFMLVDYRIYLKLYWYLYGAGILSLLGLYVFGKEMNGARSWYSLPGNLDFQPAELIKLILIISVSSLLARREGNRLELFRDVVPIGIVVFIPFALVLIQPDLGNAVIYLVILLALLWIGNVKYTHALIGLGAAVGGLFLFLYLYEHFHGAIYLFLDSHNKAHWVARIDTFLDPASASEKDKYQVTNSITAIGSGGLFGESYLHGNSIHSNFIPYAYSDSIFVVVGEEFGFVGASVLLLLYFLLIYRMILISIQTRNQAGSFMIVGIVAMLVFQIFENVGMMIGIMPLTGITLPFVSYGGTSLMINMISMGIVMSVRLHPEKTLTY